jgi:predicted GTPase
MTRSRLILLAVLFLAPFLVLIGFGGLFLYDNDLLWVWWPLLGLMGLTYFLAWWWTRGHGMLPDTAPPPPEYWTDRDRIAWEKVEAKAKSYQKVTLDEISNARHYTDLTLDLATEVGHVYNPDSEDPFDNLTLPEVLACIELAAEDLIGMVEKYVPGVHLVRIRDVKRAQKAYHVYKTGMNVYWAASAALNPAAILQTGLRYLINRSALGGLMDRIQGNLILWFHTAFIHQLGRYLIELNSGRLKVGVQRYREILAAHQEPPAVEVAPIVEGSPGAGEPGAPAAEAAPAAKPISVAVLGAVKAGKSSMVNALLGKQAAPVDRLPVVSGVRYDLVLPGGQPTFILDTNGYGENGPTDADFGAATEASCDADLILLVTPATNPGRRFDVELLDRLKAWFDGKPHLRMPPVIVVMNQVDLLTPKAEWNPPYDWQTGTRPKEVNIRDAAAAVREQVGERAADIVPICARAGETFGIDGLVLAIAGHLDHARGAAVLKAFEAAAGERPVGKVFDQLGNLASAGLGAVAGWLKKK